MIVKKPIHYKSGFTIVELLIVVVVIAILAAVTIVGYNGIQQSAKLSTIKSDLSSAGKAMELANVQTGTYPATLPSNVPQSSSTQLSLSQTSNGFCVNAQDKTNPAVQWRYESASSGIREGLCSGQVIAGSEQGLNPNLITSTSFTSGWNLGFQNGTGRTLSTRSGTTGDPFPTRPVLVLQNTGTGTTTWAILQSSGVNIPEIISGQTYTRSFWVRKIGPHSGVVNMFGIVDPNASNVTLPNGTGVTPSTEWQLATQEVTAVKNANAGNHVYMSTNTGAYTTPGWTLEFQGFELRRV